MAGAPSNGRKKSKIGLSQKPPKPSKALPSQEPLPEVTAPRYSDVWMEQVDTRNQVSAIRAANSPFKGRRFKPFQRTASQAASKPAKTKQAKA